MKKHLILPKLTNEQIQVVNGSLLGDASLWHNKNETCNWESKTYNWKFTKRQSSLDNNGVSKQGYMDWHFNTLLPHSTKISNRSNKNKVEVIDSVVVNINTDIIQSYSIELTTYCHSVWTELARKWYLMDRKNNLVLKNNKIIKIVPKDLKLTPLTVCVWFMDDGYLDAKRRHAIFCTHGFTWEDCEFLVERLRLDVGIDSHVRKESKGHPIIFVPVKSHKKLIDLIKSCVAWDCFKYKIDNSYDALPQAEYRGENHGMSKLTESQAIKMIELRKNNMCVSEIAKLFKVTSGNVSMITSGRRWKHLGGDIKIIKKPRIKQETKNQIITLFKNGETHQKIANKFNMNQSTVTRIINRNTHNARY